MTFPLTCSVPDKKAGDLVKLHGWLHKVRDHGKLFFMDLRDHTGTIQCVSSQEKMIKELQEIPHESTLSVEGILRQRPDGKLELAIQTFELLSVASPLPFPINRDNHLKEETKHEKRFLYLRRERLYNNLKLKNSVFDLARSWMREKGFLEVQTPLITCPSPEGARDFIVPARNYPGKFYALPQAPQIFKQLLMTSGIGRYFQIAPCFRDEDSRADRTPNEFYQLDIETSFFSRDEILKMVEELVLEMFNQFNSRNYKIRSKITRMTHEEAIQIYGTDKPDLRNPLMIVKLMHAFNMTPPDIFSKSISKDGATLGMVIPNATDMGPAFFDKCKNIVIANNGPGLVFVARNEGCLVGNVVKSFTSNQREECLRILGEGNGLVILSMFPSKDAYKIMGFLRNFIGKECGLIKEEEFKLAWITDFPMYERDADDQLQFAHNPFSMPKGGVTALQASDPLTILAEQYDLVCNGYELGSGALRNASAEGLTKAFAIAGYSPERVYKEFPALMRAFEFGGVPPHGGIALGLDRIVMLLAHEENLREVCAFPLTQSGEDPLLDVPRQVSHSHLRELHIKVTEDEIEQKQKLREFFAEEGSEEGSEEGWEKL